MIKAINSKYCKNNLVQLMPNTAASHLILSSDEIILLKLGDKILINKYTNHPSRSLFPFSDKEQNDRQHFTEIFEYNKIYLNFRGGGGFSFDKNYFFKGNARALFLEETLPCDERETVENVQDLTRSEIEDIFNSDNYDLMAIMDRNGTISFVRSKKDNIQLGTNVIPRDEDIVKRELDSRIGDYSLAKIFNPNPENEEKNKMEIAPKEIEDIKEFKILGPDLFGTYSHILLTSKDGKFNLKWFKIEFVEKDKFRLTTSPIEVIEPTIDDVIDYSENYDIDYTSEPYQPPKSFEEVMTEENQQFAINSVLTLLDENKKSIETEPKENGIKKTLIKVFKRKNLRK